MNYATDIFKTGYRFPNHVTILAPGPMGKEHWSRISPDSMVLAVNKAIEIDAKIDAWVVADWWAIKTDWFSPGVAKSLPIKRIFSAGVCLKSKVVADLTFGFVPHFTAGAYAPVPERFRPDGTVSGISVEMAARLGASRITLCGVDMSGSTYFDGGRSESKSCPHGAVWTYVPYFKSLINWCARNGCIIDSLSPTALDVPQC